MQIWDLGYVSLKALPLLLDWGLEVPHAHLPINL